MSNQVNRVRSSGFRSFNVGGRSKKITIVVIFIVAIIAIALAVDSFGKLNSDNNEENTH